MTITSAQIDSGPATGESADSQGMLLDVRGLKTHFFLAQGIVRALEGVDFRVRRGPDGRAGGRERLRQVDHSALDHGDCAFAGTGCRG